MFFGSGTEKSTLLKSLFGSADGDHSVPWLDLLEPELEAQLVDSPGDLVKLVDRPNAPPDYPEFEAYCFCNVEREMKVGSVMVLPWRKAFERLGLCS